MSTMTSKTTTVDAYLPAGLRTGHAALTYADVAAAGPGAQPLDFPAPRIYNSCTIAYLQALDISTGLICEHSNVVMRLPSSSPEIAFSVKQRLAKTTYGSLRLCSVLRRRPQHERGHLPGIDWVATGETVVMKGSMRSRIRQLHKMTAGEDPVKEVAALQYVGNYHPNVIGCIEVLQDKDYLFIVLPYCGENEFCNRTIYKQTVLSLNSSHGLKKSLHRLEETQARIWFRQLLQALFHLQKKGVCHGNLCLENILIDKNDNLKIVDFGMALRLPYADYSSPGKVVDVSEGSTRLLVMTPSNIGNSLYLAPEVIEKAPFCDGFSVDLWATGVILFTLLVGVAPFRWAHATDSRFQQISRGHLRQVLAMLRIPLSDTAADLLQRMLRKDPCKRLSLAHVMTHSWVLHDLDQTSSTAATTTAKSLEDVAPMSPSIQHLKTSTAPAISPLGSDDPDQPIAALSFLSPALAIDYYPDYPVPRETT